MDKQKIFACPVWYNGKELQHGVLKGYTEDELFEAISNAWSGCHWLTGETESEVRENLLEYIDLRTNIL